MDIPMLLDTTTLARGLLMLSPRPRLMLIPLFFMDPIMADMVWVMPDMLDLAMDIPMLLDTTTLARGLLMLRPRPRLMLIPRGGPEQLLDLGQIEESEDTWDRVG